MTRPTNSGELWPGHKLGSSNLVYTIKHDWHPRLNCSNFYSFGPPPRLISLLVSTNWDVCRQRYHSGSRVPFCHPGGSAWQRRKSSDCVSKLNIRNIRYILTVWLNNIQKHDVCIRRRSVPQHCTVLLEYGHCALGQEKLLRAIHWNKQWINNSNTK